MVRPADTRGLNIRGGSQEFDLPLKSARRHHLLRPSDEIYANMPSHALDAAATRSTRLVSFRLAQVAKHVTTARTGSFWFIVTPC